MTKEIIKKDNLTNIKNYLIESPTLKETLGQGQEKYINSVIFEIMKTQGDTKKDLTVCTPKSIATSIKQACDLKLEIDARQHCHLIRYGNEANLQIGYRGFVYSIKRAFPDANIDVQLVYKGDDFKLSKEGDITTYTLTRNNPFAPKTDVIGGFCYISYSIGGRLVSFCETMSLEEINKIKGCAKQQFIWNQWFEEKAKVAIIRRACKVHFAGIDANISKMAELDNQNFDLDKDEGLGQFAGDDNKNVLGVSSDSDLAKGTELKEVFDQKNQEEFEGLKAIIESCGGEEELEEILADKETKRIFRSLEKRKPKLYDILVNTRDTMKEEFAR